MAYKDREIVEALRYIGAAERLLKRTEGHGRALHRLRAAGALLRYVGDDEDPEELVASAIHLLGTASDLLRPVA